MNNILKSVEMAKVALRTKVGAAEVLVDATAGNGFDTLFLAQNSKETAKIWAFDIQPEAVTAARERVGETYASKVRFILDCHSRVTNYVEGNIDVAMFNLGYLPNQSHAVKTSPGTTVKAIEETCARLSDDGIISVIAYPGHDVGAEEYAAVENLLKNLSPTFFSAGYMKMLNQSDKAPVLFLIERK